MGILILLLLSFMILVGGAQVISAIVIALITKNKKLREHFVHYLIGVVVYFFMMIPIGDTVEVFGPLYFGLYFVIGAFGLMYFHLSAFQLNNFPNLRPPYQRAHTPFA